MSGVGKWTDAELSRWIAEFLEPKPTWLYDDETFSNVVEGNLPKMPTVWVWQQKRGAEGWQPRDMVYDAQMRWMLLEKLADIAHVRIWKHKTGNGDAHVDLMVSPPLHGCATTLGRAVAEAFAIAHGAAE